MSAVLKSSRRIRTVSVYADVDLSEIDTDDLEEELADRQGVACADDALRAIYELMAFGRRDDAYIAMRQYVQDRLGRVLP